MSKVVVDLSRGAMTTWSPSSTATTHLYLYDNELTELTDEIGSLGRLRVLDLAGNALSSLPTTIRACHRLEYLYLHGNRLVGLPAGIGQLSALRYLNLNHNPLSHLPDVAGGFSQLTELRAESAGLAAPDRPCSPIRHRRCRPV